MPWDPGIYNQFKSLRYQPFFDLVNLIADNNLRQCVDIGCGTGEQTFLLSQKFEKSSFLGIDTSKEMLAGAEKYQNERVHFELSSIESFAESDSQWDLVFSNAALQWAGNHEQLFPRLIARVTRGGQFAVQVPDQHGNLLNKLLLEIATQKPYTDYLQGYTRPSPVLSLDDYTRILFDNGMDNINASLKVYPLIAANVMELYNFIAGSALIPYMERLNKDEQQSFSSAFIKLIQSHFPKFPAIYSFKRLLLYGTRK